MIMTRTTLVSIRTAFQEKTLIQYFFSLVAANDDNLDSEMALNILFLILSGVILVAVILFITNYIYGNQKLKKAKPDIV